MTNIKAFCEFDENIKFDFSANNVSDIAYKMFQYLSDTTDFVSTVVDSVDFDKINFSFDILVTDNSVIKNLNFEYRKINAPTDVLTFSMFVDSDEFKNIQINGDINLGQIVISLERIKEQARENDVTTEFEFFNILAHGILHLLGIDHPDEVKLDFMMNLQKKMIESVCDVKV